MTLHPLTKELLSSRFEYSLNRDEEIDRRVRAWATEQTEWLKKEFRGTILDQPGFNDRIDQAFQLLPKTLEEKFHDRKYPSPEDFWDVMCKKFVEAAEEHFSHKPSGARGATQGMTLRDYFAGQALAGILARDYDSTRGLDKRHIKHAFTYSDAMLAARKDSDENK